MQHFLDIAGPGGSQESLEGRGGFVLPAVLLLLMVLSTLSVFYLSSSSDEQRTGRALRESAHSFYAADAGLNAVVAQWNVLDYDTLMAATGDSVDLGWVTLDGGASYHARIHRTDGFEGMGFYSLVVTGVGAPPFGGESQLFLELYGVDDICCEAAVTGGGVPNSRVRLDTLNLGGATVSGIDAMPLGWGAMCTDPLEDKPGIIWSDTSQVRLDNGAVLTGVPPVVEDTTITAASLFDWGVLSYDGLAAMADIVIPGGSDLASNVAPIESPLGTCFTSGIGADTNWGDPLNQGGVCANYFPIIHVTGNLRISDALGYGQGILLVDGELRIEGSFDFYGIIMTGVKSPDRARFRDNVTIHGAIIAEEELRLDAGADVKYSSCAIKRALHGRALDGIRPLDERPWRQKM